MKYCGFLENHSPEAEIFPKNMGLAFTYVYFILTEMSYI